MTKIVAINQERTGKAWSDEYSFISVVWTADNERIVVSPDDFNKLWYMGEFGVDYFEGNYIGFDKPIEWDDVLPPRSYY